MPPGRAQLFEARDVAICCSLDILPDGKSSTKRKGRKAVSTSNLRQIAIAFNIYIDDRDHRPETFRQLTENKYLTERALLCPEDTVFKNWAGMLEKLDTARQTPPVAMQPGRGETAAPGMSSSDDVPHSYFKSFDYLDEIWVLIDKAPSGGLAACQLHGIGRQRAGEAPSLQAYQGLLLRALKDGSVIPRQVFWNSDPSTTFYADTQTGAPSATPVGANSQLSFFVDPAQ